MRPPLLRVLLTLSIIGLFAGLIDHPAVAQVSLRASYAGAGHTAMTGGTYSLRGTAGQPAVSIRGADPYLGTGFWYSVRNEAVALPVELSAFTAETDGDHVRLTWQTATETNNAGFHIERRVDRIAEGRETGGRDETGGFTAIHYADGAGTTTAPQTYRFADNEVPFGADRLTYRLRQVDLDGTATYSEEVTIGRRAPSRLALHAPFPNPAASGMSVTMRYELSEATDVEIAIYDVLGRVVATPVARHQEAGRTQTRLSLSGLPSGLYFIRMRAAGQVRTQRLTVVQ